MREFVDRAVKGDAEAFGCLYDLLCDNVFRYFYYQVGQQDAEDLVSQTFLRAWRAIPSFKWRGRPFEAWLFTVARSQLMDFFRQRRVLSVELDESFVDSAPGPESQALSSLDALATRVRVEKRRSRDSFGPRQRMVPGRRLPPSRDA